MLAYSENPKIAIDGPAGAGKSTVTREVSRRLKLKHLDTGAMYRAVTLKFIRENADLSDLKMLEKILAQTKIEFDDEQNVFLNGENVTNEIRMPAVNEHVSPVSSISMVRRHLVEVQKKIVDQSRGIVMEGRDIASRVMPDADFKFFLDASPVERARRRMKEQTVKGIILSEKEVIAEIKNRDYLDSNRVDSPLTKVSDAIVIDTTNLTFEQVVGKIVDIVTERVR
ncbi:MAG: (d)CMP kinase [Bacillota bacterium]